jgi:transposase InsO family protein
VSRVRRIAGARTRRQGRRGYSRQRDRRHAEREVRRSTVRMSRWLSRRGLAEQHTAGRIGLCPRTVRGWSRKWREEQLEPRARGRPVDRADREMRNAVLSLFSQVGPEITEEQLKEHFPEVCRAELRELRDRYRAVWRKGPRFATALRWAFPGSVWALDFTHPPGPVDGIFPRLLVVRDLASAKQLAILPAPGEDAETVCGLLQALIRQHGPPLVLKMDNGAAFGSERVKDLLERHRVLPLFSPPYAPSYNGAVETGMGTLKVHAHYASVRNDRPGEWTCDDVEEARLRGNGWSRPHGRHGPTPDQAWESRMEIAQEERRRFLEDYQKEYRKEIRARGVLPLIGPSESEKRSIDRAAISRTLIRRCYLWIRRKRITPPVHQRKAAGIR